MVFSFRFTLNGISVLLFVMSVVLPDSDVCRRLRAVRSDIRIICKEGAHTGVSVGTSAHGTHTSCD